MTKPAKTAEPDLKIVDPFDVLTVAELRHGAKIVGADLQHAVARKTEDRADALAVAAWLLERRSNPNADLGRYREMTLADVYVAAAVNAGTPPEAFADDTPEDIEAKAVTEEAPPAPDVPAPNVTPPAEGGTEEPGDPSPPTS